jgi:hypothetical protein
VKMCLRCDVIAKIGNYPSSAGTASLTSHLPANFRPHLTTPRTY